MGNPTTWKGSSQTFNSANQNTCAGSLSFDANGNPAGYSGASLTWDANNKLVAAGSVLTAGYGADGLRAWKQNSSGRTYFLYDGLTPVCETDGSGNVTAVNTWGANGLLARHTSAGSVFYAFDPQGGVSVRLNTSGTVLSSHCNEAWGTQVSTGSGYASDPYAGYGGQWGYYRDSETGLHLLGHRYYDVSNGRFLNRDPMGYGGGINLYGFCGSSPVIGTDETGLAYTDPTPGDWGNGAVDHSHDKPIPGAWGGFDPIGTGGTMLGHLWTLPNTTCGLIAGAGGQASIDWQHQVINIQGGWLARWMHSSNGTPAFTLGDIVLWGVPQDSDIYQHELGHTHQYRLMGPYFLPEYGIGAIIGGGLGDAHDGNPYELDADDQCGHLPNNKIANGSNYNPIWKRWPGYNPIF